MGNENLLEIMPESDCGGSSYSYCNYNRPCGVGGIKSLREWYTGCGVLWASTCEC